MKKTGQNFSVVEEQREFILPADWKERFVQYLVRRERATGTIQNYLRAAEDFAASHLPPRTWKELQIERGYAITTINARIAAVNGLLLCLRIEGCRLRPLRQQRKIFCQPQKMMSRSDYQKLVSNARSRGNQRLALILQTICSTGMRISELRFVTAQAVHQGRATVYNKGKLREILLPQALRALLSGWMKRKGIASGPLFVTRNGKPLDRSNLWRQMKSLCKPSGVERQRVFPHNLRRLFARTFYHMEKDIARLADLLGHSSVQTTRLYIMESGEEHQRLMEQMHLVL